MKIFDVAPGIYDLSNEQYHNSNGISRSAIMSFKRSPLHYWHEKLNPEYIAPAQTPAMIFGSALHTYMLEYEIFNIQYAVKPVLEKLAKVGLLRDLGREAFDAAKKAHELQKIKNDEIEFNFDKESFDKIVIDSDCMNEIIKISNALKNRAQAKDLLHGAQNETSIYWLDPDSGLLCKARPDIWHSNMIVDLKTSADASFRACQSSIFKYGYHLQAAMILDGIKATTGRDITDFINLFTEKDEPYASAIYILEESAIEAGRKDYKTQLLKMRECFDKNEWNSYNTMSIALPNWVKYIEE